MSVAGVLDLGALGRSDVDVLEQLDDGRARIRFSRLDGAPTMTVPLHTLTIAGARLESAATVTLNLPQWKVLDALARSPEGLADHQLEPWTGLRQDSAGSRRAELVRKALAIATEQRWTTERGGRVTVWQITNAGRQVHERLRPVMEQRARTG